MAEPVAEQMEDLTVEGETPQEEGGEAGLSKKQQKKLAKQAEKEAKKAANQQQRGQKAQIITQADPEDPCRDNYGDSPMVQSRGVSGRTWSRLDEIKPEQEGSKVLLRARLHAVRGKGKLAFVVLRQRMNTVQCVMFADNEVISKTMVTYATQIPRESIVDLQGIVTVPKEPIDSCTVSGIELGVTAIHVVSRADPTLPFELADASRSEAEIKAGEAQGEQYATVNQDTRLDNRHLDLRTPANQAIFQVQSTVCQLFREALLADGFQEIHSPKLIAGASEGGASVFRLDYMGRPACLAQSPQLYKQMAICGDFERVFEIGPVFRAENSNTHRHMCEFTGLDLEMEVKEHYFEVLDVLERMFMYMFAGINSRCAEELATINAQSPFEPLLYKPCRLEFAEGIKMLREAGHEVGGMDDLSTALERSLGALVREKYGTDFYILYKYPLAIRPFYTMPCVDDPDYSNSFDVFIRGEEIISGAQRIHDPALLTERAEVWEIPVDTIKSYIDSFRLGAPPHGGAGVGLERVVMLFCALGNIRKSSLFPRDPQRLTP